MRWIIPVSDLARLVKEMRADGMDFVEISLDEGDPPPARDPLPPCVSFQCFRKSEPDCAIDYEEIDVVSGFGKSPSTVRSRL